MKTTYSVNDLETAALRAASDLLADVPHLNVRPDCHDHQLGSGHPIDGRIEFEHGGDTYGLVIEVKRSGAPRFVRAAVYRLKGYLAHVGQSGHDDSDRRWIPMLVSPYLSPESRSICLDHDVAYLDLVGNAHLAFGHVYIDHTVADRPVSETRALRSIFAPKAAAILRVLLRNPDRSWRVAELAEAANASLGHVSNVRKALLAREWIEKRKNGIVLVQPGALLTIWREEYRKPAGRHIQRYTLFHGDKLLGQLKGRLNAKPPHPRVILSSHSAAQWLAPFGRGGTDSFYADESGARMLQEVLKLTHVERGSNVTVRVPRDESLFADAARPAPGVYCASPIVTYLDLWLGDDRDREAAGHLASKYFPWL